MSKTRDQMSRQEFAAQVTLPAEVSDAEMFVPQTVAEWKEAVVNHYFTASGKPTDLSFRLKNRKKLEAAYAGMKTAYFAVMGSCV